MPLDPAYPVGRLEHVVADARPLVVVTTGELAGQLQLPGGTEVVTLDEWPEGSEADLEVAVEPSDMAYVIYTSGSTGTPKGVVIEHHSVMNLVAWHDRAYQVKPGDRGSQLASVGFDAAVWEIWPYLCAGASVHVAGDEIRADPDRLIGWLDASGITISFVPTPLAETLLDRPWPASSRLRLLLTGGDTLRGWPNPAHPYQMVNHYGPTEFTVVATAGAVPSATASGLPGIGGPIANTVCYVVDRQGSPAGPGCPGELWVGGAGLARGYLHDAELTQARFVANPFDPTPPRLYRTGDLVRWQADGTLAFLGRTDDQIKIRGYRIEPGEIETLLRQHPDVTQAIVTTHPHPATGTAQLTAYVTTRHHPTDTDQQVSIGHDRDYQVAGIKRWLQARLPGQMIPSAIIHIASVPLTAHGKVDFEALPKPDPAAHSQRPDARPTNATEELLCRLWAEVLNQDQVGIHEDFFERGGHSLLATQLVSRIRDTLKVELPFRTLFERPTAAEIAAVLRRDPDTAHRLDRIAGVLLRVMALTDEDVAGLLAEQGDAGVESTS